MREQRTMTADQLPRGLTRFVVASAALHAAAAVILTWTAGSAWSTPRMELAWLDLDNKLGAPAAAPPKEPPALPRAEPEKPRKPAGQDAVAQPTTHPARRAKKKPARAKAGQQAPKRRGPFTTRNVALSTMTPGDAALMLLLRMDRIRASKHGATVRRLLEVFYDFKTLLWSTTIDPVQDFEAMLIATPNPYRVTETFIAIRHALPEQRLREAIEQATTHGDNRIRWERSPAGLRGRVPAPPMLPQDPRVVLLRPDLALLARPELEELLTPKEADARAPDAGLPAPTLLDHLRAMHQEGDPRTPARRGRRRRAGEPPGLMLQALNLPRLVALPADVPVPQNVQVTVPAAELARVHGVATFSSVSEARGFLDAVTARLDRARRSLVLRLLGVGRLLDKVQLVRVRAEVEATALLTGDEVRELLELFRSAIPPVRVPGMSPRLPPDAGPPVHDEDRGAAAPADAAGGD